MKHTIKNLPKSTLEITFELEPDEIEPFLDEAASRLSKNLKIAGFRPGKAPRKEVEKQVGALKLLEEALESIVRKSYVEVVMSDKLDTVGSPSVDIQKLAPGNTLIFKMTVSTIPKINKLTDYKKTKIKKEPVVVSDEDIMLLLGDLQKVRAREVRKNRPIEKADRVVIDLEISQNNIPVAGGATKGHVVLMDEPYYVPGLTNELLTLKEGDEKRFALTFPEDHFQKNLAGKPVDFKIKVTEIYERISPPIDDDFAKEMGKKTLAELKELAKENILREKTNKEEARVEQEILKTLVENSDFDNIPDLLVNEEVERMKHELEHNITSQGVEWNQYLQQIKKSEGDLKLDLTPDAIKRIKATLIIRDVAEKENVQVSDKELDEELDHTAEFYKDDKDAKERIYSPAYRDQFMQVLRNRKTIAILKEYATGNKE